jgi:hypothetical protein
VAVNQKKVAKKGEALTFLLKKESKTFREFVRFPIDWKRESTKQLAEH